MFLSEWREFPSAPCLVGGKKLDDSSRPDVVEIAHVPDMLPSFFPSWAAVADPGILLGGGGVQQIQLRTERKGICGR